VHGLLRRHISARTGSVSVHPGARGRLHAPARPGQLHAVRHRHHQRRHGPGQLHQLRTRILRRAAGVLAVQRVQRRHVCQCDGPQRVLLMPRWNRAGAVGRVELHSVRAGHCLLSHTAGGMPLVQPRKVCPLALRIEVALTSRWRQLHVSLVVCVSVWCCPASFANTTGLQQCLSCPPGSSQALNGQSFCDLCSVGPSDKYSAPNQTVDPFMRSGSHAQLWLDLCGVCVFRQIPVPVGHL